MYTQYYGFSERPFSLLPDPDYLFFSSQHHAALAMLETAVINGSGFFMLSGEIGAGKTTLLRELLNRLDDNITVGLVSNTHASFGNLMQWILSAYGMVPVSNDRVEQHQQFVDFLIGEYAKKKHTLLIIDEAQQLTPEAMDELRLLSNINSDKDFLLQIVIAGQHELRDKLRTPELRQFAQRISIDYHLEYLDLPNTHKYIKHRLQHAGGDPDLFDESACDAVFENTGGVPRLINRLCDFCLVYGYAEEMKTISDHTVYAVMEGNQTGGFIHMRNGAGAQDSLYDQSDTREPIFTASKDELKAEDLTVLNDEIEPLDVFSDPGLNEPGIESFDGFDKNDPESQWTSDGYQINTAESREVDDRFLILDEDETVVQPHTNVVGQDAAKMQNRRVMLPILLIGIFSVTSIIAILDITNRTPEFMSEIKHNIYNLYADTFQLPKKSERIANNDKADFASMQTVPTQDKSISRGGDPEATGSGIDSISSHPVVTGQAGIAIESKEASRSAAPLDNDIGQTDFLRDEIQEAVNEYKRASDATSIVDLINKEAESLVVGNRLKQNEQQVTAVKLVEPENKLPETIETDKNQAGMPNDNLQKFQNSKTPQNGVDSNPREKLVKYKSPEVIKQEKVTESVVNRQIKRKNKPVPRAVTDDSVAVRRAAARAALKRDSARLTPPLQGTVGNSAVEKDNNSILQ